MQVMLHNNINIINKYNSDGLSSYILPDHLQMMPDKKKLKHRDISYVYDEASYSPAIEVLASIRRYAPCSILKGV